MTILLQNTARRYGLIAVVLHWLIAAAILVMLVLGVVMVRLPIGSSLKFSLYQWHKSVGVTILVLSVARVGWRLAAPVPPLPSTLEPWEAALARVTHVGLYAMTIALPLTGWMVVSASPWNIPTILYGVIPLPHLPVLSTLPNKPAAEGALKVVHWLAALALTGLFALHVAGALKHHLLLRDDTLKRMLPSPELFAGRGKER